MIMITRTSPYPAFALAAALVVGSAARAQDHALASRQDNQGQLMVSVTPVITPGAATWRFDMQFNTHVSPITQNIAADSVLSDDKGHEEAPTAWQGDPSGGHHRKGALLFKAFSPAPASITLKVRKVGSIPERTFTWKLTDR
ncbi:MAG: hypothetical protein KGM42_00645 [Hyphomicrobiales bacterium]|nr:hypothetical protein [Hyphomicrobiales bacterium]